MHEVRIDHDGELILTYDVSVSCHGKTVFGLGLGSDAVFKFCDIVEAGIPVALKVENLWGYNYLVTLTGKSFLELVREHYPEYMEEAEKRIDPEEVYVIDCYDMS